MPLHIPHLFGRSRSSSTGIRTDLCTTYRQTFAERRAQGYDERSDFSAAITLLGQMLETAVETPQDIDWEEWNLDSEIRDVQRFHFEDLDQTDQMLCPTYHEHLANAISSLEAKESANTFRKVWDVVMYVLGFAQQAEQLYGKELCAAMGAKLVAETRAR